LQQKAKNEGAVGKVGCVLVGAGPLGGGGDTPNPSIYDIIVNY
tara:strand:+ start:519 stop:647 length:129 start_codon:yes stop_codon:yes gene_type:complete